MTAAPHTTSLWRPRSVLAACLVIFIGRLLLAIVIVPPFQQPDEPAHLLNAEVARNERFFIPQADQFRQAEILRAMARADWWRHYAVPAPVPVPLMLLDVPVESGGYTIRFHPVGNERLAPYYHLHAIAFELAARLGYPLGIETELYVMRATAGVCGVLTLLTAWAASRQMFGVIGATVVTAVLALHPQFALVSTAAAPDAVDNLAGAFLWWQSVRVVQRHSLEPLPGVILAGLVTLATDRMALPLALAAALVTALALVRSAAVPLRLGGRLGAAIAGGCGLAAAAWLWLHAAALNSLAVTLAAQQWQNPRAASGAFLWEFTTLLFKSWWLTAGWLRYRPPDWWLFVPVLLVIVTAIGVGVALLRERVPEHRALVLLAMLLVAIQLAAVYWGFYRTGIAAQGRYLFPAIVPSDNLMWEGVRAIATRRYAAYCGAVLVGLFVLLDATAWLLIVLPAYGR